MTILLALSWSVSRGQNTYGYNICRLDDQDSGKRYRCMGGGYDMVGTVFGQWLMDRFHDRLLTIKDQAYASWTKEGGFVRAGGNDGSWYDPDTFYGMTYYPDDNRVSVDGACGIESMQKIARAIGLTFERTYVPRGRNRGETTGWMVTDTKEEN